MRKVISLLIILAIALMAIGCSSSQVADNNQAQGQAVLQEQPSVGDSVTQSPLVEEHSCPRGVTDDPYPGDCWQYTDQDQDRLCDLG
ncbi:hypothetical protein JXB28_04135 [Candidatus Woesearchaeota archaeon]|nr:hypothetical protein [Candidatus Woesearchaeota archaeon]